MSRVWGQICLLLIGAIVSGAAIANTRPYSESVIMASPLFPWLIAFLLLCLCAVLWWQWQTSQKKHHYLRLVLHHFPEPALVIRQGRFVDCNPIALNILGYGDSRAIIGKTPGELSPRYQPDGELSEQKASSLMQLLSDGEPQQRFEWTHIRADGSLFFAEVSLSSFSAEGEDCVLVTWHDIGLRKIAQQHLEEELQLFASGPVTVMSWQPTPGWPLRHVSDNVAAVLGYQKHEVFADDFHFFDLIHPEDQSRVAAEVASYIHSKTLHFEQSYRIQHKDGDYRWYYDFTRLVFDDKGELLHIRGYLFDQTHLKTLEHHLEQERQRLSNILWGTGVGTWEWHIPSGETRFNERWAEIIGYRLDELQPININTWLKFAHPEDFAASESLLNAHFAGEIDCYEVEVRMLHREGHWVWVLDRGKVISWDAEGKPLWMAGTHTDINRRKQAEFALRSSEARMRSLFDMLPDGVVLIDPETALPVQFNPAAHQQLGYSADDFALLPIPAYDAYEHPEETAARFEHLLTEGYDDFETLHRKQDGSVITVHVTVQRVELENQPHFLAIYRDITQRKETERLLALQREELARSNAELEQFAYVASHDLRQPLRMISSYVQLLEQSLAQHLNTDTQQMMFFVRDGALRMDQMLVSLLEYSRVGRKGSPLAVVDSRERLDEALHFLSPAIHEAQAHIDILGEWPQLHASRDELTRLFQNLIGNAIKYRARDRTPHIVITVEAKDEEGWLFCVKDNGIGVAPNQFHRLFKVFQRLHTRNEYEGSGVGLAVCRKIVERHGGKIWIESAGEGCGSMFYFSLPKWQAQPEMAIDALVA